MRKFTFVTTVIVLLAHVVWVDYTQAQSPQNTLRDGRWAVEIGGKAYNRPGSDLGIPLITDGITMASVFDSDRATELGSTVGAEVKFNFVTKRGRELEIRTIIADWDEFTQIEGDNLRSPFFPIPGAEPTGIDYGYTSDYFSIEVMSRRAVSPGLTCMFGPRFVSTKDTIELAASRLVDPQDGTPPVNFVQTQTHEATNALIGFQGGLELNFPVTQVIYFNSFIRAGGYLNPTEVTSSISDNFSIGSTVTQKTKSTGSFLGEVGGRVYLDILPNCLSTYVGYEATWIDGIALAPPQLVTTGLSGVETANTPFFDAVTFGVNLAY